MSETLQWFGPNWGAQVNTDCPECPVPLGEKCIYCEEGFEATDPGVRTCDGSPFHRDCFTRTIVGSLGHLQGTCSCYGGNTEDPPGVSRREAARQAAEYALKCRAADAVRDQINAKPASVRVVIQMLAVKLSGENPMDTDDQRAYWMKSALDQWNKISSGLFLGGIMEETAADAVIERVRSDPASGWGKILRANTN